MVTTAIVVTALIHSVNIVANHDIIWLKIAMTNVVSMHIFSCLKELLHNTSHDIFAEYLDDLLVELC